MPDKSPDKGVGRSETIQQQEYEKQQLPGKRQKSQLEIRSRPGDNKPEATEKKGYVARKLHDFWHHVIKPAFPEAIQDIKIMYGMSDLRRRVKAEIMDASIYPEVNKVAQVRRGPDLCPEEQAYLAKRKTHAATSFARYMGLNPEDVDPDDVPIVAFGGSGGGFRAMIGCLGYGEEMRKAGLWDCLSYVSGVSGSCWSLAAYYTIGKGSMQAVIDHCKTRFWPYHPLSGDAIRKILTAPGGARVTLGPLIQKSKSGLDTVAMDLYSVFTTGWIFFQEDPSTHPGGTAHKEVAGYQHTWHKLSSIREYIDNGKEPLPIMTAIRHERPLDSWSKRDRPFDEPERAAGKTADPPDAWYQWFEMTPYEVGCDEIEAWVPTWGFGRPFSAGKSTMQLPEQSLALLLGLATSAPAAPLASYLSTMSRNLGTGFIGNSIHKMAHAVSSFWGKKGTEEFQNHHPLHACHEHNFMYHYTPSAPDQERPPGLENSPRIQLIDSGMDNNCPTYVLLHPKREVDMIINMDASSDVLNDAFQQRVDQIGARRGMNFTKREIVAAKHEPDDPDRFEGMYAQIYDGVPCERPETALDSYGRTVTNPPAPIVERDCTMVYMPLLPNEKAVPGFNPSTAKFSGSYNLVWTAEQVDTLVAVCAANFQQGQEVVKQALYDIWQKKKTTRESQRKRRFSLF